MRAVCLECVRLARLLFGFFLYALGVVMTIRANLGLSPWDVFHQGLGGQLGISLGMATVLISVVIVSVAALLREHVGIGTLGNMLLIGLFVDILMFGGVVPEAHGVVSGLAMMAGGLIVIGFASFFYIGSRYGAGPRDSLMVVLSRRTGRPVGVCRIAVESLALFFGWLLGGNAGFGTLIAAFGVGVAVQFVFALMRFDVTSLRQESILDTIARFRAFLRKGPT
ncbi:MAG: hypothetical protein LBS93_08415 [Synergistaceae bacterium]|nr:hypothetical protein [Synergistaceae bacterium]